MNIKKLNWRDNITDIGKKSGLFEILADVKELDITYHIRNYKFYSDKASPFENLEVFTGDKYQTSKIKKRGGKNEKEKVLKKLTE